MSKFCWPHQRKQNLYQLDGFPDFQFDRRYLKTWKFFEKCYTARCVYKWKIGSPQLSMHALFENQWLNFIAYIKEDQTFISWLIDGWIFLIFPLTEVLRRLEKFWEIFDSQMHWSRIGNPWLSKYFLHSCQWIFISCFFHENFLV